MYYYMIYKGDSTQLRQVCFQLEIIYQIQVSCFPRRFSLWILIYMLQTIYTTAISVVSLQALESSCAQPLALQMMVQVGFIALKTISYIMLCLTWCKMYPHVYERMKCTQQCVHFYVRVKEFTIKSKCVVGASIMATLGLVFWAILGISYGHKETDVNGYCFRKGLATTNFGLSSSIISIVIMEAFVYMLELLSYRVLTSQDKAEVKVFLKNQEIFNKKNAYNKENRQQMSILHRQLAEPVGPTGGHVIIPKQYKQQCTSHNVNEQFNQSQDVNTNPLGTSISQQSAYSSPYQSPNQGRPYQSPNQSRPMGQNLTTPPISQKPQDMMQQQQMPQQQMNQNPFQQMNPNDRVVDNRRATANYGVTTNQYQPQAQYEINFNQQYNYGI